MDVQAIWTPEFTTPLTSPAQELGRHLREVSSGRITAVLFPDWPLLSQLTQALVPGAVTVLVGDPGVGKTFLILQAMVGWIGAGVSAVVMFIEKDRKFHTHRLLAQLEGDGSLCSWDWCAKNGSAVSQALERNAGLIDELGASLHSRPESHLNLGELAGWIREQAQGGARVIVVDPITAVDAGENRWRADDEFMISVQRVLADTGASLVLVTHSKKGTRPGAPTGHDQAGGAAFFRFSDTNIWLKREKKPRKVELRRSRDDVPWNASLSLFFQIHKARNGRGAGLELGYEFGNGLRYAEQGVVIRDVKDGED